MQVLEKWAEQSGWSVDDNAIKITTGVRDGLSGVWEVLKTKIAHVWTPSDVYPVYSEIIPTSKTYELMNEKWLNDLLGKVGNSDAILLPAPIHPIGRHLLKDEEAKILDWLGSNSKAWLLVDTAYDYTGWSLFHERCITLRTMSKSWLCRRMFGLVVARADLIAAMSISSPNEDQLKYCYGMLRVPNLPLTQRNLFTQAWRNIHNRLHSLQINFTPPATGYLTVSNDNQLAQRTDILSIPATVFGSKEPYRVISCLGEIKL